MKLIWVVFLFLLLPLCNAEVQSLGTFKQNECVNLLQNCGNCTYNNISSIIRPNSSISNIEVAMASPTPSNTLYTYSFCNTSSFGQYIINGYGNLNGDKTSWSYDFQITPAGEKEVGNSFLIFIYILFGAVLFSLLFTFILNIAKFVTFETTIYNVAWSWGIYFVMMFILWMINQYIVASFIRDNMNLILTITGFTHVFVPILSFAITIFKKGGEKKRLPSIMEMQGRMGYG